MDERTTHYRVLGVDPRADSSTIRGCYVALARKWHPDYHALGDPEALAEAQVRIRAVNEAWRVLGHPQRRAEYDKALRRSGGPGFRREEAGVWVPFDDGDDPDPRDLVDDRPIGAGGRVGRVLTIAPMVFLGVAVGLFALGVVVDSPEVLTVSVVVFGLAVVAFLAVPLVALARSARSGA